MGITTLPRFEHKRNAIVILGAGITQIPGTNRIIPNITAYPRIYEGLKLYQACQKSGQDCKIIISGGDPLSLGISEAMVYQNELLQCNVKRTDIQIEPLSPNTYKNAELTSILLKKERFESIFLVASALHMKRVLLYFSHFGITPAPVPSDYMTTYPSMLAWGYNLATTDFALHEYIGILRYYFYNWMGWNVKASAPSYSS